MKHKPDIKLLVRYLELTSDSKESLAKFMSVTTNAVDQWLSQRKLPKTKRRFILTFLNEQLIHRRAA